MTASPSKQQQQPNSLRQQNDHNSSSSNSSSDDDQRQNQSDSLYSSSNNHKHENQQEYQDEQQCESVALDFDNSPLNLKLNDEDEDSYDMVTDDTISPRIAIASSPQSPTINSPRLNFDRIANQNDSSISLPFTQFHRSPNCWMIALALILILSIFTIEYYVDESLHSKSKSTPQSQAQQRQIAFDAALVADHSGSTGAAHHNELSTQLSEYDPYAPESVITAHNALVQRTREYNALLKQSTQQELKLLHLDAQTQQQQALLESYAVLLRHVRKSSQTSSSTPSASVTDAQLLEASRQALERVRNETDAARTTLLLLGQQGALSNSKGVRLSLEQVTRVDDEDESDENDAAIHKLRELNDGTNANQTDSTLQQQHSHTPRVAQKLIDSHNNEYILSKAGDANASPTGDSDANGDVLQRIDTRLIVDLGIVIVASAIGGCCAALLRQPVLIGYLLSGSVIGPGGLRLIGQFVQVETLAQFGATFLLFALGVEFSIQRLMRVRNVALAGGILSMSLCVLVGAAVAHWLCGVAQFRAALCCGLVLSMSSTTVVIKQLSEQQQHQQSQQQQQQATSAHQQNSHRHSHNNNAHNSNNAIHNATKPSKNKSWDCA
jgi:hypothetical protein